MTAGAVEPGPGFPRLDNRAFVVVAVTAGRSNRARGFPLLDNRAFVVAVAAGRSNRARGFPLLDNRAFVVVAVTAGTVEPCTRWIGVKAPARLSGPGGPLETTVPDEGREIGVKRPPVCPSSPR